MKDIDTFVGAVSRLLGGWATPLLLSLAGFVAAITIVVKYLLPVIQAAKLLLNRVRLPADERRALARRLERRRSFARQVWMQIQILDDKVEWRDDRFTELEAEVDVPRSSQTRGLLERIARRKPPAGIRRVPSLTVALEGSDDPIIHLQGDPGSGKSVALRHVAKRMAEAASRSSRLTAVIPLYINLKDLRPRGPHVDAEDVRRHVHAIYRGNDRTVAGFFETEFDEGLHAGTWFFLFDSFDEMPAVLAATEVDTTIEEYSEAIYAFLTTMSNCRGVVASREFRGPRTLGWPRFWITALTEKRKVALVRQAELGPEDEQRVLLALPKADRAVREMSSNPLFLGLICEYVRTTGVFPPATHVIFESYVEKRLSTDAGHLRETWRTNPEQVCLGAEEIAYCMWSHEGLGLEATRAAIHDVIAHERLPTALVVERVLDALVYVKLARASESSDGSPTFTFAHRRFQEYFATRFILRDSDRVTPLEMLTDGRWRETAVVIVQTQAAPAFAPLMAEAAAFLDRGLASLKEEAVVGDFTWPTGALHVVELLDAGLSRPVSSRGGSSVSEVVAGVREHAAELLAVAGALGRRHDRKWAIDAAGAGTPGALTGLVRDGFRDGSPMLRHAAFAQLGRLTDLPEDVAADARRTLVGLSVGGELRRTASTVEAEIAQLGAAGNLQQTYRLLRAIPAIDLVLHVMLGMWLVTSTSVSLIVTVQVLAFSYLSLFLFRATTDLSWPESQYRAPVVRTVNRYTSLSVGLCRALLRTVIFMRVAVLLLLFRVPTSIAEHSAAAPLILACATWAYAALWAASRGIATSALLWPLLPAQWIASAVSELRNVAAEPEPVVRQPWDMRRVLKELLSSLGKRLASVVAMLASGASVGVVGYAVDRWATARLAINVVMALVCLGGAWRVGAQWVRTQRADRIQLRRFDSLAAQDAVTGECVITLVGPTSTDRGVLQLLRRLERTRLAFGDSARSIDIRDALSDVVAAAEILRGEGRWSSSLPQVDIPSRIAAWDTMTDGGGRVRLGSIGQDALDEMARIVAAGRRSSTE